MKLSKIVVATDFSDNSLPALETALSLSQETGAELHLLHVVEMFGGGDSALLSASDAIEVIYSRTREQLRELIPDNLPEDLKVKTAATTGKATSEIALYAQRCGADMIVVGTHGRKGLSRMLMGSTAESLLREAPCQVLVVKPRSKG